MSDTPTPPTAADLLTHAADAERIAGRYGAQIAAALRAGADAMDERDQFRSLFVDGVKSVPVAEMHQDAAFAARLLAGLRAELARLREEYAAARSLLDTIADAPLKLDLARQTISQLQADLDETRRHWSEDTRDLNEMEAEIARLRADRAALAAALREAMECWLPSWCKSAAERYAAALAEHGSGAE